MSPLPPLFGVTPLKRRPGRPGVPLMTLVLLLTLAAATPARALEPVRVLIVHAYSQEYPWTKGQHEGFVSTLTESLPLPPTVKTEYLDSKRLGLEAGYQAWFADYLGQKYQGFHPQLLYVTDDDGLRGRSDDSVDRHSGLFGFVGRSATGRLVAGRFQS